MQGRTAGTNWPVQSSLKKQATAAQLQRNGQGNSSKKLVRAEQLKQLKQLTRIGQLKQTGYKESGINCPEDIRQLDRTG
jgi:hypothetical protein